MKNIGIGLIIVIVAVVVTLGFSLYLAIDKFNDAEQIAKESCSDSVTPAFDYQVVYFGNDKAGGALNNIGRNNNTMFVYERCE